MPIVLKSGSLNLLEPSGPVQGCNGIALPLPLSHGNLKYFFLYYGKLTGNLIAYTRKKKTPETPAMRPGCNVIIYLEVQNATVRNGLNRQPVAGSCQHGNEHSGSIKSGELINQLRSLPVHSWSRNL